MTKSQTSNIKVYTKIHPTQIINLQCTTVKRILSRKKFNFFAYEVEKFIVLSSNGSNMISSFGY